MVIFNTVFFVKYPLKKVKHIAFNTVIQMQETFISIYLYFY